MYMRKFLMSLLMLSQTYILFRPAQMVTFQWQILTFEWRLPGALRQLKARQGSPENQAPAG
jgi:hypothetical protein